MHTKKRKKYDEHFYTPLTYGKKLKVGKYFDLLEKKSECFDNLLKMCQPFTSRAPWQLKGGQVGNYLEWKKNKSEKESI